MKWLLLGAVLAVLLLYPTLLAATVAMVASVASQPVAVAFAIGMVAGIRMRRMRGASR